MASTINPALVFDGVNPSNAQIRTQFTNAENDINGILTSIATAVTSIGAIGSSPTANGAIITSNALILEPADGTHPGYLDFQAQTIGGVKTFAAAPNFSSLTASLPLQLDGSKNVVSSAINLASSSVTGTLAITNGGTGQASASAAFGALSPLTTKGDILAFSTVNARLPVGTDGQIIVADSTQTLGIKWATASASGVTTVAPFSGTSNANGLLISGSNINMTAADGTNPGGVSTTTQTFAGAKTFASGVTISATTNQLILGTTNTTTISSTAPSASRVYTIPDAGANGNLVVDSASNTFTGTNIFTGTTTFESGLTYTDKATATPTTGGTVTVAAGITYQFLKPAGTLATLTVNLPTSPADGQKVCVSTSQQITALTLSGGSNTLIQTAASLSAGSSISYLYDLASTSWWPITA